MRSLSFFTPDDFVNDVIGKFSLQHVVKHACEISVKALIPRNQLVREGKTRHQTTLLQPVDGTETTREQDSLNGRERNQSLGKGQIVVHPLSSPQSLLLHARNSGDSLEQTLLLFLIVL